MTNIKAGSTVVVSNPYSNSFAYRGTLGKVVSVRNSKVIIKSENGNFSTWQKEELLFLHN